MFYLEQRTAYEIRLSIVGSERCIRDRLMRREGRRRMLALRATAMVEATAMAMVVAWARVVVIATTITIATITLAAITTHA